MERLFRDFDWSRTSIGPPEHWPVTWCNAVRIILDSGFPTAIGLGPQLVYFYNDAFIPLGGPARHPSALGQPVRVVWSEIWPDILQPRFSQTLAAGLPTVEADLLMPLVRSGYLEETYLSFSFAALRDDDGQPSGIFCTATDNTERVIAQRRIDCLRQLAASSSFAESPEAACGKAAEVLEEQPRDVPFALIYLLDRTGQQAHLAGSCGLLRLPDRIPKSLRLTPDADPWGLATVAARSAPILIQDVQSLLAGALSRPDLIPQQALALPIPNAGSDGLAGLMIAGLNPMRPAEESRAFHLLVAQQLETAISNARAKRHAEQRAEELTELNRAKTIFLSNVSHELRTPLTLVLSPIEQLQGNGRLDEADRARLAIALRGGRRLQKLVDSLLQFSRAEEERIDAQYEPTDLARLTADLTSMFRSLLERAGVTLRVHCPSLGEAIYVDPEMWEKILLNLVSNALKFTIAGEISVSLSLRDDVVELEVADTGCGISEKDLPHVFERFFRGDARHARSVEGTGIGLSLVRELVRAHRGCISARSTLGVGTTITVQVPRGKAHLPADRISTGRAAAPLEPGAMPYVEEAHGWLSQPVPVSSAPASSEEILVVDDNADMREHLARLLEARWRVSTASDGSAALQRIRARAPELVLSDIMMPGLDGFALLGELRKDPATADIPVLLLSARAGEEASAEGLKAGADDYIVKPFSARDLIARIELHLARARAKANARRAREAAEEAGRARDEFFATLFHEIRTPLASLQTWIELLKSGRLSPANVPAAFEGLETSSNTLTGLVQDLLDYSAVVRGELRVEPRPAASVLPIILPVVRAFQPVAQMKELQLECAPTGSGGPARVDALRLQQVVWNLISNAIRHTPSGGRVDVMVATDNSVLEIMVRDTGQGIAPDELPQVFGRYWRGRGAGAVSPGLGLGLAISRRIVELHGGSITAHSAGEGRGATFTVRLPLSRGEDTMESGPYRTEDSATRLQYAVTAAASRTARPAGKVGNEKLEILEGAATAGSESLRILLVEDDDGLARACQRLLSSHGHRVVRTNGCTGALLALKCESIDVIITDVHLADGDAIQLLKSVRDQLHRFPADRLPAVAMSAFLGQKEVMRYRAAGFAAQISKPFQEGALLRAIREAARQGSLNQEIRH
ncbi:MAG TPA: ATP-binding protein [Steroidobacteraceae bacterium]|nr:ATP-binding protein [Steroidobacteraceae bacterium]